jgi:hypothetical protein
MFRPPTAALGALLVAVLSACGKPAGSVTCGIVAFIGPLVVKESFGKGATLTTVPGAMPAALPVRLVAGRAWRGTVARDSTGGWLVTMHGTLSKQVRVGYGVLVVDYHDTALGVLAFDAQAIRGAPRLGTLAIGDTVVPLLGVRIDPATIQNPKCPVFPDSLR